MIMNVVWPITALYFGPAGVWGYFKSVPKMTKQHQQNMQNEIRSELRGEQSGAPIGIPSSGPSGERSPSRGADRRRHYPLWSRLRAWRYCWRVVDFWRRCAHRRRRTGYPVAGRFSARLGIRSRVPVLHDRSDERFVPWKGPVACHACRYAVDCRLSGRNVSLGPANVLRAFSESAPEGERCGLHGS